MADPNQAPEPAKDSIERPSVELSPSVSGLRASDDEREQVVAALHTAVTEGRLGVDELEGRIQSAYTVRTRGELELLIADVSERQLTGDALARATKPDGLVVREGPGGNRWVVSIMAGAQRRGRWRVGKRCTVLNVMGGSEIDLCDAELADAAIELNVYSFMGGAEVRVPNGVEVQVSDVSLMGGNDVQIGDEHVPPGGPVIHVKLVSIMAGVSVRRGRKQPRVKRGRGKDLPNSRPSGELEP
jgi:hypothetical protein